MKTSTGRNLVTINARKFDGSIHRSWVAELVRVDGPMIELVGVFNNEFSHPDLGVIRRGTVSYEYYWLDRWYNVFRFHEPDGNFRNFYCNVNVPPVFDGSVLDYVDLDLDLLIGADRRITVLDSDEFAENSARFNYGDDVRRSATDALAELQRLAGLGHFPFSTI